MPAGWSGPLLAVVLLWVVVGVACSPLLLFPCIQTSIGRWPTGRTGVNYLVLGGLVVFGHAGTFFSGIVATGGFNGDALVRWTMAVAGGFPIGLWLLAGVGMAAARGPESVGEKRKRWLVFGLAALWYAVVIAVAAAIVFFVLFVLYFPD